MGFISFFQERDRAREIRKLGKTVSAINAEEARCAGLDDAELARQTDALRDRFAAGETLDDLLVDAFATVREASKRVLRMRHFDVQLMGGIALFRGKIAEMKTGEGKTLVATLPAYLNAVSGRCAHIVTVNDYLAKRDAEWMGKLYGFLGLKVGCILPGMTPAEKRRAYDADVTYCTNNELGFDYLRDNMAVRPEQKVMVRGRQYAIVDEVDSILIDEARTPLILSGEPTERRDAYVDVQRFVNTLKEGDYIIDEKDKYAYLSDEGIEKSERYFRNVTSDAERAMLATRINNALRANFLMSDGDDYIVEKGGVVIVDQFTGRKMEGRRFSDGLHQAIEAKENVRIRRENPTVASITFQNYFRLYEKLAGMTGTAVTEEAEFKGIYNLDIVVVPPNKKLIRVDEPDKIFISKKAKFEAAADEIAKIYETSKQPVLVGTISVEVSEKVSAMLRARRIPHNVLNARSNEAEAMIIAQAGKLGAVTIATNMAGRGTDILLGGNPEFEAKAKMSDEGYSEELIARATAFNRLIDEETVAAHARYLELLEKYRALTEANREKVIAAGGLRVIGTERYEARRIDNQLRGRSGRQGDIGSSCFFLSFEDDLLLRYGGERLKQIVSALTDDENLALQSKFVSRAIESAQKRCEEANFERRKYVLNYDDVLNKQRNLVYSQREQILNGLDAHEQVLKFIGAAIEDTVAKYVDFSRGADETEVDYGALNDEIRRRFVSDAEATDDIVTQKLVGHRRLDLIVDAVRDVVARQYEEKCRNLAELGIDVGQTERRVFLNCIDRCWVVHLNNMDILREGIGLRGLGQRDPVIEYRREGSDMFDDMIDEVHELVAVHMCKISCQEVRDELERRKEAADRQSRNLDEYRKFKERNKTVQYKGRRK